MEITKNIRKDNQITKEKFIAVAQKVHESETKPIKIIGDEGAPTIREVINNQKRLAVMIEYVSQLIEQTK
ncbi:Hypothetical protein Nlim_1276 [Candidatus Nitrosarchaeum limnium SFB1]|jgi:hypothetical protein|uniref:Uncharacterized protein n=1 Tax=Candidatus Nitrosarchaeum limnium SFB1 TaxID=886738 RepID=F3KL97_9ARCH|nr:Hypothetical protein Nlim_1276 [Candidatus Nitrosarchaeum limnium SFB1]